MVSQQRQLTQSLAVERGRDTGQCVGRMKERERRRPGEPSHGNAGLTPGKGGERKEGWWEESHTTVQISKQSIARLMGAPKQDTLVCSGVPGKKTPQTR